MSTKTPERIHIKCKKLSKRGFTYHTRLLALTPTHIAYHSRIPKCYRPSLAYSLHYSPPSTPKGLYDLSHITTCECVDITDITKFTRLNLGKCLKLGAGGDVWYFKFLTMGDRDAVLRIILNGVRGNTRNIGNTMNTMNTPLDMSWSPGTIQETHEIPEIPEIYNNNTRRMRTSSLTPTTPKTPDDIEDIRALTQYWETNEEFEDFELLLTLEAWDEEALVLPQIDDEYIVEGWESKKVDVEDSLQSARSIRSVSTKCGEDSPGDTEVVQEYKGEGLFENYVEGRVY